MVLPFKNDKNITTLSLLIILLVAAAVRFYGLNFGEPFNYHPDETKLVVQAGRLLATTFMDKDAYFGIDVYPPFYTYLLAAAMGGYIGVGLLTGRFESLAAVQSAYETSPFQFFLVSRALVAMMGVLSVLIIYLIGKRLYSTKIGLPAALLLATNFLHTRNSHFGTVDVPAAFIGLLCIYFCVRIFQDGKTGDYLWAAVFAALAFATKFNMLMVVFPILFAHFARFQNHWFKRLLDKKLWLAAGAGIVAVLFAFPLIWLDFRETWGGILGGSRFEKVGKIGSGGGLLSYWTGDQSDGFGVFFPNSIPETFGLLLTLAAAAGLVYLVIKHRRQDLFLLFCIVPMYLLFEKMSIKAMRHILPIIPFLLLAVTVLLMELTERIKQRDLRVATLSVILLFFSATQIKAAINYQQALLCTDPRTAATNWILARIPQGSAVAVESFPPVLFNKEENGYIVYETGWTSKTLAKRAEFQTFANDQDSLYYIADDFSRQIFSWKFTKQKYPDITADRLAFFQWLDEHAELLQIYVSENPQIQPTIKIYLLKGQSE